MLRTRKVVAQLAICCVGLGASGLAFGATVAQATPTGTPSSKTTTNTTTTAAKKATTATAAKKATTTTAAKKATVTTAAKKATTTAPKEATSITTAKATTTAKTSITTAKASTTAKTTAAAKTTTTARTSTTAKTTTAAKQSTVTTVAKKSTVTTAAKKSTTKVAAPTTAPASTAPATTAPATTAPVTTVAPAAPTPDAAAGYAQSALAALRSGDSGGYNAALSKLAGNLSGRVGVGSSTLQSAWKSSSRDGMIAMLASLGQLGVAYQYNASTPQVAFDCSGLTAWAWAQSGVSLPHQSLLILNETTLEDLANVAPGDIIYYPGHIMIALGVGGAVVHAAGTTLGVIVSVVSSTHAGLQVGDPTPAN